MKRHANNNLRKVCGCPRRQWPKCDHPWHLNFKWAGATYRFSLDRELKGQPGFKPIRAKTDAETARDQLCADIRNGTFQKRGTASPEPAAVLETLTLGQLFNTYERAYVNVKRPASQKRWRGQVDAIGRRLLTLPTGEVRELSRWAVTDLTTQTIEEFQALRQPAGIPATNRDLSALRAIFNWAVLKGLMDSTPFKRGGQSTILMAKEDHRSRRLQPEEAEKLLAACGSHLRAIVEAALETGCRRGELLSMQWSQVRLDGPRPAIVLTAAKTKTRTHREIPISARLKAILEMRRNDADNQPHKPTAYVFGEVATGERVKSFKRSWATAKLRAHGYDPEYAKGTALLTTACLETLRSIDLHFHDLRREAGSRWLDAGVPLHTIQRWLGHSNIAQTSTYLCVTDTGSHEAMMRFDQALGRLPQIATEVETGTRTNPQSPATSDTNQSKPAERTH